MGTKRWAEIKRPARRRPTHPGTILLEDYMIPTNPPGGSTSWTVADLAERSGLTADTIDALIAERASVTHEIALGLSRALGTGPEMWLNLQETRDLWDHNATGHTEKHVVAYIITTDAEHAAALKEIERLWEAEPGTPEGDRLNLIVDAVVAYEDSVEPWSRDELKARRVGARGPPLDEHLRKLFRDAPSDGRPESDEERAKVAEAMAHPRPTTVAAIREKLKARRRLCNWISDVVLGTPRAMTPIWREKTEEALRRAYAAGRRAGLEEAATVCEARARDGFDVTAATLLAADIRARARGAK